MLKAKRYSATEWNDTIMPLVENGTLIMVYQKFHGILKTKSGDRFSCTGCQTPSNQLYVDVKKL
jgi:hypothetical protein